MERERKTWDIYVFQKRKMRKRDRERKTKVLLGKRVLTATRFKDPS